MKISLNFQSSEKEVEIPHSLENLKNIVHKEFGISSFEEISFEVLDQDDYFIPFESPEDLLNMLKKNFIKALYIKCNPEIKISSKESVEFITYTSIETNSLQSILKSIEDLSNELSNNLKLLADNKIPLNMAYESNEMYPSMIESISSALVNENMDPLSNENFKKLKLLQEEFSKELSLKSKKVEEYPIQPLKFGYKAILNQKNLFDSIDFIQFQLEIRNMENDVLKGFILRDKYGKISEISLPPLAKSETVTLSVLIPSQKKVGFHKFHLFLVDGQLNSRGKIELVYSLEQTPIVEDEKEKLKIAFMNITLLGKEDAQIFLSKHSGKNLEELVDLYLDNK